MPDTSANNDVDLTFLMNIADGSDEFIVESIGMFLENTPKLLQEISDAIANRDWTATTTLAHQLKPNLGFFGMLNSQALVQDIEILCKEGTPLPEDINTLFDEVKGMVNAGLVTLKQIHDEKAAGL